MQDEWFIELIIYKWINKTDNKIFNYTVNYYTYN